MVAAAEMGGRVLEQSRWPTRSRRLSVALDACSGLAIGVGGGAIGWGAVVVASSARVSGWEVLLVGGVAAVAVISLVAVLPSTGSARLSSSAPPAPSERGRLPARGTRLFPRGRRGRRGPSSG